VGDVVCLEQREQAIVLDQIGVVGDEDLVAAGGDPDADTGAGGWVLERSEASFEVGE
jgi:hypothetical protein